jgi:hypothetical protein
MSITVTGTIEKKSVGMGVYALVTADKTYELRGLAPEHRQSGLQVKITGELRSDIMTIAMIGPVLELRSLEVLSP